MNLYLIICVIPIRESGPFIQSTRLFKLEKRVIKQPYYAVI